MTDIFNNVVIPISNYALNKYTDHTYNNMLTHGFKKVIAGCEVYLFRCYCGKLALYNDFKKRFFCDQDSNIFWVFGVYILLPDDDKFYKTAYHTENWKDYEVLTVRDKHSKLDDVDRWLCGIKLQPKNIY
jgi:hypothetical protein